MTDLKKRNENLNTATTITFKIIAAGQFLGQRFGGFGNNVYLCTYEYNERKTRGDNVAGRGFPREGRSLFEVFHRELSAQGTMSPLARGAVCRYVAVCPDIHESPQSTDWR